jgi:hypothetical protein
MVAFPAFYGLFYFLRLFASKIFILFVLLWDTEAEDNLRGDKLHDCCSVTSYQLVRTYQSVSQPTTAAL